MFHALDSATVYYGGKIERWFVPKFYHDKNTINFLKELKYFGEFDTIDKVGFSGNPTVLGRKPFKYRQPAGELKIISTRTSDNDWPFPDIYFKSIGCKVRGFSFLFPNTSDKLKENLLPSEYLLSIESGTEETSAVLTQNSFFPTQKDKVQWCS